MSKAKKGDIVQVHYEGKLTTGNTFDSSKGGEPLQFKVGEGQVIKGFDEAVEGMETGEKKSVTIPVDEAYGQPSKENFLEFPKSDFPEGMDPKIGEQLHLTDNNGNHIPVIVTEIKADTVILDANHPLAGKDLIFDIELVSIQ